MNATNTNKIPECYRDFYVEPETRKLIKWAHLFESKHSNKNISRDLKKGKDKRALTALGINKDSNDEASVESLHNSVENVKKILKESRSLS